MSRRRSTPWPTPWRRPATVPSTLRPARRHDHARRTRPRRAGGGRPGAAVGAVLHHDLCPQPRQREHRRPLGLGRLPALPDHAAADAAADAGALRCPPRAARDRRPPLGLAALRRDRRRAGLCAALLLARATTTNAGS